MIVEASRSLSNSRSKIYQLFWEISHLIWAVRRSNYYHNMDLQLYIIKWYWLIIWNITYRHVVCKIYFIFWVCFSLFECALAKHTLLWIKDAINPHVTWHNYKEEDLLNLFSKTIIFLNINELYQAQIRKRNTNFDRLFFHAFHVGRFDHVTRISESRFIEQKSIKWDY